MKRLSILAILATASIALLPSNLASGQCPGSNCECVLSNSLLSTTPGCTSSLTYSVTGTNGCCNTHSCSGTTPVPCSYVISMTGLSVGCCWYIVFNGTQLTIPGGCTGSMSFTSSTQNVACGRTDTWDVYVDPQNMGLCNCNAIPLPGAPHDSIRVTCTPGSGCCSQVGAFVVYQTARSPQALAGLDRGRRLGI